MSKTVEIIENKFSKEMPCKPGLYEIKCEESNQEPTTVAISRDEKDGRLIVHCPDVGVQLLAEYHISLAEVEWKKIA